MLYSVCERWVFGQNSIDLSITSVIFGHHILRCEQSLRCYDFLRSDKNGQDQETVHERDSAGGTVCEEKTREARLMWFVHILRKCDGLEEG